MRMLYLPDNFRPGEFHSTGNRTTLYSPGWYRIPVDMSKVHADRAVDEAGAKWEGEIDPEPRRRKSAAPENKAR